MITPLFRNCVYLAQCQRKLAKKGGLEADGFCFVLGHTH